MTSYLLYALSLQRAAIAWLARARHRISIDAAASKRIGAIGGDVSRERPDRVRQPDPEDLITKDAAQLRLQPSLDTPQRRLDAYEQAQRAMAAAIQSADKDSERKLRVRCAALGELVTEDRVRDLPRYSNRLPTELALEKRYAAKEGFVPVSHRSPRLHELCQDEKVKYVVTTEGQLRFGPDRLKHAVLSDGQDVLAAGFAVIVMWPGHPRLVTNFDNYSGHFQPPAACLQVAEEAFKRAGFVVAPNSAREVIHEDSE